MPPQWKNWPPLQSANECRTAKRIRVVNGHDFARPTSCITPASVTGSVLAGAETWEDSDRRSRIINNEEDPHADDGRDCDDNTPEPNESMHDNDELTAPSKINLDHMVEQQHKIVDFLFQHNTKLLEQCGLSPSNAKDKLKMEQLHRHCTGARELEINLYSLWSNSRTH